MFNKYRNIKKIGLVLIGLALVIFLITNVRIRSVDSYRKQFSNMADSGQTHIPIQTEDAHTARCGTVKQPLMERRL
jgi:flagellar biosynthesis/type III secretory pathway M-ring protein FliF/YscJ